MAAKERLQPFLDVLDSEDVRLFAKRLSANDTGASGAHQAGIYVPNDIAFDICPRLAMGGANPDAVFEADVMSHGVQRVNRLTWYNQKSRNECRITRWGDDRQRNSVLQQDLTGALVVLLFKVTDGEVERAWVWFCADVDEEEILEYRLGVVEPGAVLYDGRAASLAPKKRPTATDPCAGLVSKIPSNWLATFPDGKEIVGATFSLPEVASAISDERLIARRSCEYRLFLEVERRHVMPRIDQGFASVEEFVEFANSVTNRRKSRSGRSFELHLERIFDEERLPHTRGGKAEGKKTPDFLFPSQERYHDPAWPTAKLRMLGVKTTCKDRWRQILNEADKIPVKHLITLQEGVSVDQFAEMSAAGIVLVVPDPLRKKYPKEVQGSLKTLDQFIAETKNTCAS